MEHDEYKEVVGGDDDLDEMDHCWSEQNIAREDTNVRDNDDVDQMNHCWTSRIWQERTLMWEVMMM
jgi:hypothetical protein